MLNAWGQSAAGGNSQFFTRMPPPQPSSSQDWPLDPLQFKEIFPLRQVSMKGKFLS